MPICQASRAAEDKAQDAFKLIPKKIRGAEESEPEVSEGYEGSKPRNSIRKMLLQPLPAEVEDSLYICTDEKSVHQ